MADKLEIDNDYLNSLLTGNVETKDRVGSGDINLPDDTDDSIVNEEIQEEQQEEVKDTNSASPTPQGVKVEKKTETSEVKDKNPLEDKGKVDDTDEDLTDEGLEIVQDAITKLQDKLGIEFTDEQLATVELKGDIETINAIAELGARIKSEKLVEEFLKGDPEVYEYAMHIKAGGTKESYFNPESTIPNLSNITIDKSDESSQEKWYRNYLKASGTDEEEIEDLITVAKDRGTLYDKSVKGFDKLKDHYDSLRKEEVTKNESVVKQQEEDRIQTFNDIKKTLDSGKILNTPVSKEDSKAFFEYFIKPLDKSGMTMKQKVDSEISLEKELLLEYIKFKDFKGFIPETEVKKLTKTLVDLKNKNDDRKSRLGGERNSDNFNTGGKLDWEVGDLKDLLNKK